MGRCDTSKAKTCSLGPAVRRGRHLEASDPSGLVRQGERDALVQQRRPNHLRGDAAAAQ